MRTVGSVLVGLIGLLHVYILVLEMFLWNTPFGRKRFRRTPEEAAATAVLAANQGLYNGFLAAGLFWSLLIPDPAHALATKTFFLGCVLVAGLYGGLTAMRAILFIQAVPALVALGVVRLAG
jgi:putative membrane protein